MPKYTAPFLLSDQGSDRATAYTFSNKAVTLNGKTHVVWTDAVAFTRGRTFDHATYVWGDTVTLGEGTDNHNSPSLTADAQGRLRIAYGPHATYQAYPDKFPTGNFKFSVADSPGSFAGMEKKPRAVGYGATYPSLLTVAEGRDAIVYRGGEVPYGLIFQQTRVLGGWTVARELMRQDIKPEYTHWGAHITVGGDGTLYVAGHFYALSRAHSLGVAILKSRDAGETWTDMRGEPVDVPIVYGERYAVPHCPAELDPRMEGIDVDSEGRLWALTSTCKSGSRSMPLSCWEEGRWRTIDLADFVPAERAPVAGGLCVDTKGRIHVVASTVNSAAVNAMAEATWWSHASLEVAHLMSADGGRSFTHHQVSEADGLSPNWLPTISRSGPFHRVENPVILYTHGMTGQNTNPSDPCRPTTKTNVYCVRVEC
jgi:hypothetical protein